MREKLGEPVAGADVISTEPLDELPDLRALAAGWQLRLTGAGVIELTDDPERCPLWLDPIPGRAPCPGHGRWETARELPLAAFVAAICAGAVKHQDVAECVFSSRARQFRGSSLWVTRQYWVAAREQSTAHERYEAWARPYVDAAEAAAERAEQAEFEHQERIAALLARQDALIRPTVEWVFQSAGVYPRVESGPRTERFSMGVPVFIGDKLHALICPVASRITPRLAGWYSTATIVVADEPERARIARVTRAGQRFRVIDPGPLEPERPERVSPALSMNQVLNRMFGSW